ncbi:MAG: hypothetical protein B7Z08_04790 [Sphingomonadales bacterium 32-68-7]|nr:MAG: hypothetical protein B7Z33_08960 [Sphingomonadales bacterium 12-68-11]OYX09551.1 MAG: hypothetical protein B7Z08_04790 [Sphingomonadales bacterium 32-68-7]
MGQTASWRLMVAAAIEGAKRDGYLMKRQPGRGLSNTYAMTKDGVTKVASVRTTRDRWVAFPPLNGGKNWKTLDDAEVVLVSAADDRENPQNVDVYLFPADEVRKRFDASYAARIQNGHMVPDDYGMWVMLDKGDDGVVSQVGHGLAAAYPAIARFSIDELEADLAPKSQAMAQEASVPAEEGGQGDGVPELNTVADVLAFAREKIAALTGMPTEAIKLDLKMGV